MELYQLNRWKEQCVNMGIQCISVRRSEYFWWKIHAGSITPITLQEVAVASSLCISALRESGAAFPPYSDGIFFCNKEVYSFVVIQYD